MFDDNDQECDRYLEKIVRGDLTGPALDQFLTDNPLWSSTLNALFVSPVSHKLFLQGRFEDALAFIKHGGDVNITHMANEQTLLHLLISQPPSSLASSEHLEPNPIFLTFLSDLFAFGADPNKEDRSGFTPLHQLYLLPDFLQPLAKEIVLCFVKNGADLNIKDFSTNYTPAQALDQLGKWNDQSWQKEVVGFLALERSGILAWDSQRQIQSKIQDEQIKSVISAPRKM